MPVIHYCKDKHNPFLLFKYHLYLIYIIFYIFKNCSAHNEPECYSVVWCRLGDGLLCARKSRATFWSQSAPAYRVKFLYGSCESEKVNDDHYRLFKSALVSSSFKATVHGFLKNYRIQLGYLRSFFYAVNPFLFGGCNCRNLYICKNK